MGQRAQELWQWVVAELAQQQLKPVGELQVVSGDASFRRYFRVNTDKDSMIAVDAPPEHENCRAFVAIARAFFKQGLHVPQILAVNWQQGFLLLSDLGNELYLPHLTEKTADKLYQEAIAALLKLQQCQSVPDYALPPYDQALLQRELELFREWFLTQLLQINLSTTEQQNLDSLFIRLIASALEQPQVCVHRDYHSRNLMWVADNNPGILDFQDAVWGPFTYDLVSLLRDCYIAWPEEKIKVWGLHYWQRAQQLKIIPKVEEAQFWQWFDLMGVQRHLKAIGIFSRLNSRDHKPGYLADIPRTLHYVWKVTGKYPALVEFRKLIQQKILPVLKQHELFAKAMSSLEGSYFL